MASSTNFLALRANQHMSDDQTLSITQLENIQKIVDEIPVSNSVSMRGAAVTRALRMQDHKRYLASVFRFLDLPAEIRHMIYDYSLVVGKVFPKTSSRRDGPHKDRKNHEKPETQLFLVGRQVFQEAAPMFFAKNLFVITSEGSSSWPWAMEEDLQNNPLSRLAYKNVRSLSIPLVRDFAGYLARSRLLDLHSVELVVIDWHGFFTANACREGLGSWISKWHTLQTKLIISGPKQRTPVNETREYLRRFSTAPIIILEPGTYL